MSACPKDVVASIGTPLRIRSMAGKDLMRVWDVERNIYDFPWTLDTFISCLGEAYENQVVELRGRIVGYGIMQVAAEECHLLNLGIESGFQGCGLGRSLLRSMLDACRLQGARRAVLEVRESNAAARMLYAAENFNEVGLRKNYYPTAIGREDALVLARLL